MEMKYYRDLDHNYLIISGAQGNESYQYKMIGTNRLEGLVPCTVRYVNGETFLYYEIDSMLSLSDRYGISGMRHDDFCNLMLSANDTVEQMKKLLLGEEGIIFSKDTVFQDTGSDRFYFIYCPFKLKGEIDGEFSTFSEELLTIIDHEDKDVAEAVYKMCEYSQSGKTMLKDMINLLQTKNPVVTSKESIKMPEGSQPEYDSNVDADKKMYADSLGELDNDICRKTEEPEKESPVANVVFCILFTLVICAMAYIRLFYNLSYRENILSLIVIVVCVIMAVISLVGAIRRKISAKSAEKVKAKNDDQEESVLEMPEYTGEPLYPDKNNLARKTIKGNNPAAFSVKEKTSEYNNAYDATTIIDGSMLRRTSRLYSRGNEKSIQISLEKLPVTVGKLAGGVDMVLNEESVSRIHAKIYMDEEEQIILKDMNSTNGTYRNGRRLAPGEKVKIMTGDEVCFGNCVFDYL